MSIQTLKPSNSQTLKPLGLSNSQTLRPLKTLDNQTTQSHTHTYYNKKTFNKYKFKTLEPIMVKGKSNKISIKQLQWDS